MIEKLWILSPGPACCVVTHQATLLPMINTVQNVFVCDTTQYNDVYVVNVKGLNM